MKEKDRLAALGAPIEQLSLIPRENLEEMAHTVSRVDSRLDNRESQIILDWLSTIKYNSRHEDSIKKFQDGTGKWLLNSQKYQHWLQNNEQTLFCHGIPGAGKTIFTSLVTKELHSHHDTSIGIAYFHFTYDQQHHEQEHVEVLKCLLRQLCERQVPIPGAVRSLYEKHRKQTPATIDHIMEAFQAVANIYKRNFIIIDALDECRASEGHRMKFIQRIKEVQTRTGANIFMTSRNIPEVMDEFAENPMLEIRANTDDVRIFLDKEIPHLQFQRLLKGEAELEETIKTKICEISDGIFLLASLLLSLLDGATNKEEVQQYLQDVRVTSNAYGNIYKNLMMHRIEKQSEAQASLAKRTLAWIVCAMEPLDHRVLRDALAVQPKDREFNSNRVTKLDTIISVCCGLVTVDKGSDVIRLVHFTAQEYFKQSRGHWFQDADTDLATACITYLSFPTGSYSFEAINRKHPPTFFRYAAINWGHHARRALVPDQNVVEFLKNRRAFCLSAQILFGSDVQDPDSWKHIENLNTTGIHLAAYFGLAEAIRALLSDNVDPDLKYIFNQTPLILAAENGHDAVVQLLLATNKVNPDSKDMNGQTPLIFAAGNGHDAVVQLLLATNKVDPNLKDIVGQTPLLCAAENGHDAVVKLLVAVDKVDANSKDQIGQTPLLLAAGFGHEKVCRKQSGKNCTTTS
ncbi:ankyrin repeat protein [Xylaria scruposa]|nr:ankyrin repeat protein [Xylaria scruposa]